MTEANEDPPALLRELEEMASVDRLSHEELEALARRRNSPRSVILGLRTFYFPERPDGRTEACVGLPCAMRRSAVGLGEPSEECAGSPVSDTAPVLL